MHAVDTLNRSMFDAILGMETCGLSWHGLSSNEMKLAIRDTLEQIKRLTLVRHESAVLGQNAEPNMSLTGESPLLLPTCQDTLGSAVADLIRVRKKLLTEYKAATGNPSSMQIYQASNSGIFKPEFYKWLKGALPADSKITIRFERFLQAKRRPSPRNSAN